MAWFSPHGNKSFQRDPTTSMLQTTSTPPISQAIDNGTFHSSRTQRPGLFVFRRQSSVLSSDTLSGQADARTIQASTGLWTHIKWAKNKKNVLCEKILAVRKTINTLDKIILLKEPYDPTRLLTIEARVSVPSRSEDEAIQKGLESLHRALRSTQRDEESVKYAAHIATPFAENWALLDEQTDLPLRNRSIVSYVQRETVTRSSELLLLETPLSEQAEPGIAPVLQSLNSLVLNRQDRQSQEYTICGSIASPKYPNVLHQLFKDTVAWTNRA